MAREIGRLVAVIDGDLSGLERAVNDAAKVLGRAGSQFSSAGKALSLGVTAPIVAIGGLAIKASMDFETAFAGVRKTVDATAPEFDKLRTGIIDMSKEMPIAASEIAKVVETAGQLGIKTSGLLEFAKTMVMVGKTTDISAEEAATGFAHLANIMEIPQEQIKNLASGFVMLSNEGASTGAQIIDMAERISGAGHAIGLTAPQVLAFSAGLADLGINAEAGGSAFSRLLLAMANASSGIGPSEEALKNVADAQIAVRDASEQMGAAQRGVRDAFEGVTNAQRGVRDAYDGVTQAQRGVRDATEGITNAQHVARNATESLRDAQKALTDAYRDQRQASLDARRETLSVSEAQQGLREVMAQSGSQSLELRSAQLALADAQNRLKDSAKKGGLEQQQAALAVAQAQQRLQQVIAHGPRYSLDLQNAQLRLAEAQARVGQAAKQQADKITQAQRGVRDAADGVKDAARGQRNAVENLQSAQQGLQKASENVGAAQINLRNATEGVGTAQISARDASEKLAAAQDKLTLANAQAYGTLQTFADVAGMLPEDFAALFKSNPAEAIIRFVDGLKKAQAEGSNLFKIFEKLDITNIRQIDELLRMAVGQVDFGKKIESTNKAVQEGTYLTDKYGEVTKTTAAKLEIMRNRVNANMIALGDELTPVLLNVTQNMMPMLDSFGKLTALFAAAPGPVQTAIIGFLGFSAALGPSLFGLGQLFKMTSDVMKLAPAFRSAFLVMRAGVMALSSSLLTPPVGIIVALLALAVVLYIFRDDIYKALKPALEWATEAFGNVSDAVTDGLGGALDFVKSHWKEIATLISGPFAPIVALATNAFGIRSALEGALSGMLDTAGSLAGSIGEAISTAFSGAASAVGSAIDSIVSAFTNNFNAETMGEVFGFWLTLPLRMIRMGLELAIPAITTFFGSTLPGAVSAGVGAFSAALDAYIRLSVAFFSRTLPNAVVSSFNAVTGAIELVGNKIVQLIVAGINGHINLIAAAPGALLKAFVGAFNFVTAGIELVGNKITDAIVAGINAHINLIAATPKAILSALVSAFNFITGDLKDIGWDIVKGIWQGILSAKDWFFKQVEGFFKGLVKSAKSAVGIKSPSTVFAEIGENIVKGLAIGLQGAEGLTVAMPKMAEMPMVQMPTYAGSTGPGTGGGTGTGEFGRAGVMPSAWGDGYLLGDFNYPDFIKDFLGGGGGYRASTGLNVTISGPVKVVNQGLRQDAKGALGDLAFGVQGQLNRRGIYA